MTCTLLIGLLRTSIDFRRYENWAAWLIVDRDNYTFGQVAWVDHPYYLPNFSNALAFTFPFVVENCALFRCDIS